MKKVIVFGFEDVLFNVSNVEKRMRKSDELVKRLEDVKEILEFIIRMVHQINLEYRLQTAFIEAGIISSRGFQ